MGAPLSGLVDDGLRVAIESATTGIVIADTNQPNEPLVYVNRAFEALTGYSGEEIHGQNCRFLQGEATNPDAMAAIKAAIQDQRSITLRLLNYRKDQSTFWNELTLSPILVDDGGLLGFVGVQKDVTTEVEAQRLLVDKVAVLDATRRSLEEARRDLQKLAQHDALTGLASRRLFFDRLNQSLARSQRTKEELAVIVMDLNGFKAINDRYGHETGDCALRAVADRMRDQCRQSDTLARMGGDEFLLLMDTSVTEEAVAEVCERLTKTFDAPFDLDCVQTKLGVSLGVAVHPRDGETAAGLVRFADAQMYAAKAAAARDLDTDPFQLRPIATASAK